MYKYLIVLSDDGIGDIVGITLDRPIHEVYQTDNNGSTYIDMGEGLLLDFYLHSVLELKDIESVFIPKKNSEDELCNRFEEFLDNNKEQP